VFCTTVRLPAAVDVNALKTRLYDDFRIEAPLFKWNEQNFMRVSFQGYNTREDAEALVSALAVCLKT
jgi:selenocysteine lyase/cysteine desulfurase